MLIADYLDDKESASLREKLLAAGIESAVKRHGLPFSLGAEVNYKVIINGRDSEKAGKIAREFRRELERKMAEKMARLSAECPRCASRDIAKKEKRTLLEKLRFAGVEVRRCGACGEEWYT